MGKHLNEELGSRYVQEWFGNALFEVDGKLHKLHSTEEDVINVRTFKLDDPKSRKWETNVLPASALKTFEAFAHPPLGYREYQINGVNWVGFFATKRSAHRGLKTELLHVQGLPIFNYLRYPHNNDLYWEQNEIEQIRKLFRPTFTKYKEGLLQLQEGRVAGIAVSPQLAIGLSITTSMDRAFDVYFRNRVVGSIDMHGNMTLTNKIVERDVLRKVLQE